MPRFKAIPGGKDAKAKEKTLSLVYGLRLYPADIGEQIEQVVGGEVQLRDRSTSLKARVTKSVPNCWRALTRLF